MDKITMISTAPDMKAYLAGLRAAGVKAIALDLEADQGSYRYRYSISIVQCFDGERAVVIDALALGSGRKELVEFLESPDIAKVMFSSKNDLFITQNVFGCGISPIRDIAVAQKLLGLPVNLSAHLGIDKKAKDGFQRANWLRRPISKELLAYAVGDVTMLLKIEQDLRARLTERKLLDRYLASCAALPLADYRIDQYRQYENKVPGYSRLGAGQKELARLLWIFRELVGEHFDCPVGYILSTKAIPDLVRGGENDLAEHLERELNRNRGPDKRLKRVFIDQKLLEARKIIASGIEAPKN